MRATNLVIGTAMLAVIGAALAGVLVAQKVRGARNQDQLRIVFNGSASGRRRLTWLNYGCCVKTLLATTTCIPFIAALSVFAPQPSYRA